MKRNTAKYYVRQDAWLFFGGNPIVIGGFCVLKRTPSPGRYMGIRLRPHAKEIADFGDDEKTARAVCRDLNRATT